MIDRRHIAEMANVSLPKALPIVAGENQKKAET
jgi:hypothetical protein